MRDIKENLLGIWSPAIAQRKKRSSNENCHEKKLSSLFKHQNAKLLYPVTEKQTHPSPKKYPLASAYFTGTIQIKETGMERQISRHTASSLAFVTEMELFQQTALGLF